MPEKINYYVEVKEKICSEYNDYSEQSYERGHGFTHASSPKQAAHNIAHKLGLARSYDYGSESHDFCYFVYKVDDINDLNNLYKEQEVVEKYRDEAIDIDELAAYSYRLLDIQDKIEELERCFSKFII